MNKIINKTLLFYPMVLMISYWVITKAGLPFVNNMSSYFHTTPSSIQTILSIALIVAGLSPLIWGPIIEHLGFKKFLYLAIILSIMIAALMIYTPNVYIFALSYICATTIIFSLSVCSRSFPFIYFESTKQKQKAISYTFMGVYVCSFGVPLIAGWIGFYLGWKFAYSLTILWLLLTLFFIFFLPKKQVAKENISLFNHMSKTFSHIKTKGFLSNTIFVSLMNGLAWTYIISLPFWYADAYHINSKYLFLYLIPVAIPGLLCPLSIKIIKNFLNDAQIIKLSISVFFIGGTVAIVTGSIHPNQAWVYIIPGFIINLGSSLSYPMISTNVFKHVKGDFNSASGLFSLYSYVFFGICVFIESFIHIQEFYLEGFFILALSICMCLLLPEIKRSV